MSTPDSPSPLLTATMMNAQACAQAANHAYGCDICPQTLSSFLDATENGLAVCADGARILRLIRASQLEIARAASKPFTPYPLNAD